MRTAEEDYIKIIYELSIKTVEKFVKTKDIVTLFNYTTQSVIEMVKKLEERNFLTYAPYKGVKLTKSGNKEAIRMVRAHRIWEVMLAHKLGLDWSLIHQEAENLEHAASDLVVEKLYALIGRPKYCTHGNPIPDLDGNVEKVDYNSLINSTAGSNVTIKRVLDYRPLLSFLEQENIKLNDSFIIKKRDDFNQIFILEGKKGKLVTISYSSANMIYV